MTKTERLDRSIAHLDRRIELLHARRSELRSARTALAKKQRRADMAIAAVRQRAIEYAEAQA